MHVLITGGAGFIGYHLAERLVSDGHTATLIDNFTRGTRDAALDTLLSREGARLIQQDITQHDALASVPDTVDVVYHLAAINGTQNFYEQPYTIMETNLQGTRTVLEWLKTREVDRLIYTSSSEVYADIPTGSIPTPEAVPVGVTDLDNPRFSYAVSKIACEKLIQSFAQQHALTYTILRPHNIYGPRMGTDHVIPEFLLRILSRTDPFDIYGPDQTRAFCYIDDCVDALQRVLDPATENRTVHVGTSDEITIRDLASTMFDLFDHHPTINEQPAPDGSVDRRCPDITKLQEATGYTPGTSLEDGLEATHDWYRGRYEEGAYTDASLQ